MISKMVVMIVGVGLISSVIFLLIKQVRMRTCIKEMEGILKDVLEGNDGLHLFSYKNDNTFQLSMQINRLMDSYKKERIAIEREQNARKQLLSNISHDVRTPLVSVIGYLEAIKMNFVVGRERDDYLDTALGKSYELKKRVDQLFELVRLDANEILLNFEKTDLCELVRSIVIDLVPILERDQIELQAEIPDVEYFALVDVEAFKRAIQNLIHNALLHGKTGKYLGVQVLKQERDISIYITDHGEGIAAKDIDFVFDRLYKGDASRTQNGGLGLAIAYELVQKLGGKIKIVSSEQGCTVFNIIMPCLK